MMNKRALKVILVFLLAFIWINSMLSRETSQALSDWVKDIVLSVLGIEGTGNVSDGFPIRKIAHFLEFALLGADYALLNTGSDRQVVKSFLSSVIVASIDESIQYASGRGNSIADVMLDSAGALFGIIVTLMVLNIRNKAKKTDRVD